MANSRPRSWIWFAVMLAATAWYAWPQAVFSLFPVYDILRVAFPEWAETFRPWIESIRSSAGG
jgi:hypothetical protein